MDSDKIIKIITIVLIISLAAYIAYNFIKEKTKSYHTETLCLRQFCETNTNQTQECTNPKCVVWTEIYIDNRFNQTNVP